MAQPIPAVAYWPAEGVTSDEAQRLCPARQTDHASAFDVRGARVLNKKTRKPRVRPPKWPIVLKPGELVLFGTGICMSVPVGFDCQIRPRSGLSLRQVILANSIGTVDPDYRGEVGLLLWNSSNRQVRIKKWSRVAQILFTRVEFPAFVFLHDSSEVPATRRGTGGFGYTGLVGTGIGTSESDMEKARLDNYWMWMAVTTSMLSDCVRKCPVDEQGRALRDPETGLFIGQARRYGAIAVSEEDGILIASGYNHVVSGCTQPCSEYGCMRTRLGIESGTQIETCNAIHAEAHMIGNAAKKNGGLEGCTIYVNARPCKICAKAIAEQHPRELVVLKNSYADNQHGLDTVRKALIPIREISLNPAYIEQAKQLGLNPAGQ